MSHTPTVELFRDATTGIITLGEMAPDRSRPYVAVGVKETTWSPEDFENVAWDIVSQSLATFCDREVDGAEEKSRKEIRQIFQADRQRQKSHQLLTVYCQGADSLLLILFRGKQGNWVEVKRAEIANPIASKEFIGALRDIGFL